MEEGEGYIVVRHMTVGDAEQVYLVQRACYAEELLESYAYTLLHILTQRTRHYHTL